MAFAALFPGQGSKTVGMLADFETEYPDIKETFNEASDALGYNLWVLAQEGPAEQLSLTEITQPLMLTAGVALYRAWSQANGQSASYMAGHSLGEYTAFSEKYSKCFKPFHYSCIPASPVCMISFPKTKRENSIAMRLKLIGNEIVKIQRGK